jgi:hypothetical protein
MRDSSGLVIQISFQSILVVVYCSHFSAEDAYSKASSHHAFHCSYHDNQARTGGEQADLLVFLQ